MLLQHANHACMHVGGEGVDCRPACMRARLGAVPLTLYFVDGWS